MARRCRPCTLTLAERLLRDLAYTLDFDEFFQKAAAGAAEATRADAAGLVLRDGDQLRYRSFFGLTPTQLAALDKFSLPWGSGAVGQSVENNATLYTASYPDSPYAIREFIDLGIQSSLVVPIIVAGHTQGALVVGWFARPKRAPSSRVLQLIETLAAFIGNAYHRSTLEATLARNAHHDLLTGLPNRVMLEDRLAEARKRALRRNRLLAVTLLDIDGFKNINDEMGHGTGDYILARVAERLAASMRATDIVSRYGGDEFVILFEDITHLGQLENILDRVLTLIRQPVPFKGREVAVTISVGVTIYPFDDQPADRLLQHADQAMYEAKRAGGDQYRCFDRTNTLRIAARSRLRLDIEKAIHDNLWSMTYQPIVNWEGQTVALEGRMRWLRSDSVTIREEDVSDLLGKDIRAQFFERALAISKRDFRKQLRSSVPLHLNLHAADLDNERLLTLLDTWCQSTGITPERLILEIPDTAVIEHLTASRTLAQALQDRGIGLLVDDFRDNRETCLGHLVDIPVSGVKCVVPTNYRSTRLIHALTAGVRALGLVLYGQAIDDGVQSQVAKSIGCTYGQGAFFGPELQPSAAQHWLKTATHHAKRSS